MRMLSVVLPHLRSGRVKALAVGTLKRSALLPDLQTLDELGIKGYDAANTYSIATAAGTPPAIVKRLHTHRSDGPAGCGPCRQRRQRRHASDCCTAQNPGIAAVASSLHPRYFSPALSF